MRELQKSHIWPKLAYKRYVADQTAGGRFNNLQLLTRDNRQTTDYWLCSSCELRFQKWETPTARLLDSLNARCHNEIGYGNYLLPFAVSLSWRVANYYLPKATNHTYAAILRPAMKRWREWLLGKKRSLGQFTQHAFICFDEDVHNQHGRFYECLGGEVFHSQGLLLSRIGPLMIVAFLERRELSAAEVRLWEMSEINPISGLINRISKYEPHASVTARLAEILDSHEWHLLEQEARLARE